MGSIVAWGNNSYNQVVPPEGYDFIAVDAGHLHSLALRNNGSIVGWGNSSWGEAEPPADSNFVAIAAGWDHSLGLRRDGSIVGWGRNHWGQITPPDGNDFVAIAGGGYHSLALRKNGKVVGWGGNEYGQGGPPPGDSNDFVSIAAGWSHSLALKKNGSIVAWGSNQDWSGNWWGQAIPPDGNDYIAIDAGCFHSLALKKDGSIVGWGCNLDGRAGPPPGDGNDFIAIIAGQTHNLALKKDGSIVGWGTNVDWLGEWVGQATPPDGNDFVAIAAGGYHSLAIKKAITLNETHSTESRLVEMLVYKQASSDDITVTGDVNGTVVLNDFEIVTIQTGPFTGEGFSTGNFESTLEGAVYTGEWKGVVFLKPQERRIYLKGSAVGEILATVEGYLTESVPDSNIYDQYEATWKIGCSGDTTMSATIHLNGTLTYHSTSEFPDTELYVLQSSIEGSLSGHYAGSLIAVINHIRIDDVNKPHSGEGFSIISFTTNSGQGQGWTCDKVSSPGIVKMNGLFDSPLFGIVLGTLDERTIPRTLFATIERIDLGLPPMADLEVKIWGPTRVSPGQTINYIIEYRNDGLSNAYDTVVVVQIPSEAEYISSTSGGIYRWETHEAVWKLGTIQPRQKGYLSVNVYFPWGIPNNTSKWVLASYETSSVEKDHFLNPGKVLFDLIDYLLYEPLEKINQKTLTPQEFAIELSLNERFNDLYEYSAESGFSYCGSTRTTFNTGSIIIEAMMVNLSGEVTFLTKIDETSFLKAYTETGISYFDREGGMSFDLATYSLDSWGTWAIPGSLTFAQCMRNCIIEKAREWVITNNIKYVSIILAWPDCRDCKNNPGDLEACARCTSGLANLPGVGEYFDVRKCNSDCKGGLNSHICTGPKKFCRKDWWTERLHIEVVRIIKCDTATGIYEPLYEELICRSRPWRQICKDGECVDEEDLCGIESFCNTHHSEVSTARDPSVKYGPEGRVSPGQQLNYMVEYENEGEGIAFGVYFTDRLDEDLNDATLKIEPVFDVNTNSQIAPPGIYNPATRTITWYVGEVGPGQGGYTALSANVKSDAPPSTDIINFATVYFPSVPEETRTNGVVSIVIPFGDIDRDGDVDLADYAILANQWLQPPGVPSADIAPTGGDGIVDFWDLSMLADHWLEGSTL